MKRSLILPILMSTIAIASADTGTTKIHGKVFINPRTGQEVFSSTWFGTSKFGLAQMVIDRLTLEPESFQIIANLGKGIDFNLKSPPVPTGCDITLKGFLNRQAMSSIDFKFNGDSCEPLVKSLNAEKIVFELDSVPVDGTGILSKIEFSVDQR